jgi:site-specific recombinase XerC
LTAISHTMLQEFADQLSAQGLSPSSVRNTILPLRAIFRRAHRRGEVAINPDGGIFVADAGQATRVPPLEDPRRPRERDL